MMKLRPVSLNRKCLSPSSARLAITGVSGRRGDGCACARHLAGVRSERGTPAGAQQLCGADHQEHDERAGRRPQEPRRILLGHEAPPQIVAVLDVPMAEEAQPEHAKQDRRDREQPAGREALGEQRRLAVEGASTGRQREQGQGEHRRLLDMKPAQQAEDDARRQDQERREIRAIQAPAQSPGHQQKQQSGDAAEEVRELDDAERHHLGERLHAVRRWSATRPWRAA